MNTDKRNRVLLLIGSNKGDRKLMLDLALDKIAEKAGVINSCSAVYETEPWGFVAEQKFLNQAVEILTELSPHQLLSQLQSIEEQQGRIRIPGNYRSRTIDIDIMFYNQEIISDETLAIPHPLLQVRRFALVPLAEIAGDLEHPVMHMTLDEILVSCEDQSEIRRFEANQE